jgi:Ca-activated chloride channel family protein
MKLVTNKTVGKSTSSFPSRTGCTVRGNVVESGRAWAAPKTRCSVNILMFCLGVFMLSACSGSGSVSNLNSSTSTSSATNSDAVARDSDADAAAAMDPDSKGSVSLKRNFYFVFDGSGSMKDAPHRSDSADQQFHSKIEGAKWAVSEFMKKVPKDVNLGLYVFDANGVREVLPLGPNNRDYFLEAIEKVKAKGGTPLGTAIAKGSDALEKQYHKQLGYGDYRLIVITDGEATDSLLSGVAKANKYRIPIYTIGFDMGDDHSLRKHSISYRSADSAKQLESALEESMGELDMFDPADFKQSKVSSR